MVNYPFGPASAYRLQRDPVHSGFSRLLAKKVLARIPSFVKDKPMSQTENGSGPAASVEEIQRSWSDVILRVEQLETACGGLEAENKQLRQLLERVIEHRKKSHAELVTIITTLVAKLPMNDLGVIIARLVEHSNLVNEISAALVGGRADDAVLQPALLKNLDKTRRDLTAAIKPLVEELVQLEAPFEAGLLQGLVAQPESFFAPAVARANRGFVKGQVARERIVREFGEGALPFFKDLTTDVKNNPRPKPEEIMLGFVGDFETQLAQAAGGVAKAAELLALFQKVRQSRATTDVARAQKNAFLKLSFVLELLHYYENQSTESPDVIFAQRLPPLIEQLVLTGDDKLDEKLIQLAESLLAHILNGDHRQAVINNVGKAGGLGRTLRFVLTFRTEKVTDPIPVAIEFVKHLVPADKVPTATALATVFRLVPATQHRRIVEVIMASERLRKGDAEQLGKAVAKELGLPEQPVAAGMSPEKEQQLIWDRIKEMIVSRSSPAEITAAIRTRLHAKYDADEVKSSWLTLSESDPMTLVRVFCLLPYLPDGQTDPVARAVLEAFANRLTHEKYAATYTKVIGALKNLHKVKADSPALVNFVTLVKWVDADSAAKIAQDIGMALP